MTRNIDHRIEVGYPVYDKKLKKMILDVFELQWSDTSIARIINAEQSNSYKPRGNKRKVQSQISVYNYLKAKESSTK